MQVDRFAAATVLMAAVIASPLAALAGSAPDGFQVAQAGSAAPRLPQPTPAPAAGNQGVERQIADLRRQLNINSA